MLPSRTRRSACSSEERTKSTVILPSRECNRHRSCQHGGSLRTASLVHASAADRSLLCETWLGQNVACGIALTLSTYSYLTGLLKRLTPSKFGTVRIWKSEVFNPGRQVLLDFAPESVEIYHQKAPRIELYSLVQSQCRTSMDI